MQKIYYSQYWIETIWMNGKSDKDLSHLVEINEKDKIDKANRRAKPKFSKPAIVDLRVQYTLF